MCVLRNFKQPGDDKEKFILHRAGHNFVILNIYPYISGHLMIVPFAHLADLDQAEKASTDEMMDLAKLCQSALREVYKPNGMNLGMNFGKAAGAGVAEHFHHAHPSALDRRRKFYDLSRRNAHDSRTAGNYLRETKRQI